MLYTFPAFVVFVSPGNLKETEPEWILTNPVALPSVRVKLQDHRLEQLVAFPPRRVVAETCELNPEVPAPFAALTSK